MANDKPTDIQFIQHRLPPLEAGDYELKLTQTINVADKPFEHTQKFIVQGPRFSLPAGAVVKTFPPKESTGEYGHVLPHLVLQSRTLPWEREVMKEGEHPDKGAAWLALLVFDQTDANFYYPEDQQPGAYGQARQGTVELLRSPVETNIFSALAGATLNTGQKETDRCRFIDVAKGLFAEIAPTLDDLPWLSHVQKSKDSHHSSETSVIMANRLPKEGSMSVVHLVSLEGMGEYLPDAEGNLTHDDLKNKDFIRLVSLHSWTFNAELVKIHFAAYLEHLNQPLKGAATDGLFRVPPPYSQNEHIQAQMRAGYVPLRYRLRTGEQETAWYRGPFSPQAVEAQVHFKKDGPVDVAWRVAEGIDKAQAATTADDHLAEGIALSLRKTGMALPARSADSLLLYSRKTGLCTASYAAAWQLGRLLALADEAFSTGLYQWKTQLMRKAMVELRQNTHLGSTRRRSDFYRVILNMHNQGLLQAAPASELPTELKNWLADLLLLRKVPFHYLVADAKILPKESLKFFRLDINWLACLFDGAFSLGRSAATQWEHDQAYLKDYFQQALKTAGYAPDDSQQLVVSGFLWRSAAVKGWDPGIEAEAFATVEKAEGETPLSCPRWENLAPDTKLALFNGELKRLIIHEPALGTHFGIDPIPNDQGIYTKGLRYMKADQAGKLIQDQAAQVPTIIDDRDALDINQLQSNIAQKLAAIKEDEPPFTAADFALQMIEGVEGARFVLTNPNS